MKFKFLTLSTALLASLLFSTTSFAALKSGTYEATQQGQNGPLTVQLTVKDGKILSIDIKNSKETVGIGEMAVKTLPAKILAAQSANINGISGATVTSKAILTATADCIKQAGGNPTDQAPQTTKVAATQKDLTTDLVIVGGGAAGMLAAINAAQHGLKVTLLEKMDFLGGASSICSGVVVIQGSEMQKQLGEKNDTPAKMAADLLNNGHQKNDLNALVFYANNVGKAIDWAKDLGVQFVTEKGLDFWAEYKTNRAVSLKGACPGYAQTLREKIAQSGAQVLLGTKAEKILMENNVPAGVIAKSSDGTTYTIKAKAILMATGGFGANKEMLAGDLKNSLYYGPVCATGDGHRMMQAIGAKMQLMENGKIYPQGIEARPGIALSTFVGTNAAYDHSGILVNRKGERIINERGAGKDILAVQLKQPDATLFLAMDQKTFDAFRKGLKTTGVTDAQIEQWLQSNGKTKPVFAHGNSWEEAAKNAGVSAEGLKSTIAKFNGFVKAGADQDFGRPKQYLNSEISLEGPVYLVEQKPRFATTLGGVVVNDKMQVIGENGQPIPNVYAAGEIANAVHGDDSAPGANVAWGITSGKAVSDEIIRVIGKK